MHGIIMTELKNFTVQNHGNDAWRALLGKAGIPAKMYLPISNYDDSEATGIVVAASEMLGLPVNDILFEFGKFAGPNLLNMYRSTVDPSWKTEQLLLNVEETIHNAVRIRQPDAQPPKLKFKSIGPGHLHLHYDSERKMAAVAKGIMTSVALHFNEKIEFIETENKDGSVDFDIRIS